MNMWTSIVSKSKLMPRAQIHAKLKKLHLRSPPARIHVANQTLRSFFALLDELIEEGEALPPIVLDLCKLRVGVFFF